MSFDRSSLLDSSPCFVSSHSIRFWFCVDEIFRAHLLWCKFQVLLRICIIFRRSTFQRIFDKCVEAAFVFSKASKWTWLWESAKPAIVAFLNTTRELCFPPCHGRFFSFRIVRRRIGLRKVKAVALTALYYAFQSRRHTSRCFDISGQSSSFYFIFPSHPLNSTLSPVSFLRSSRGSCVCVWNSCELLDTVASTFSSLFVLRLHQYISYGQYLPFVPKASLLIQWLSLKKKRTNRC